MVDVLASEVCVVVHVREVLKDLLTFEREEAPHFLDFGKLNEQVCVLELLRLAIAIFLVGVIAHQVLCEEDARVESLANRLINRGC